MHWDDQVFVGIRLSGFLLRHLNGVGFGVRVGHPVHVGATLPRIEKQGVSQSLAGPLRPAALELCKFLFGPGVEFLGAVAGRAQGRIVSELLDRNRIAYERPDTFQQHDPGTGTVDHFSDNCINMLASNLIAPPVPIENARSVAGIVRLPHGDACESSRVASRPHRCVSSLGAACRRTSQADCASSPGAHVRRRPVGPDRSRGRSWR